MVHLSTATPERFSGLAPDPAHDLERLRRNLDRGSVRPEHLLVVPDDDGDLARLGLFTHPDGTTVTYADQVAADRPDLDRVYRTLLDGVARAARATGLTHVHATVVDRDEPAPRHKRAALAATGWGVDDDRLELEARPTRHHSVDGVVEVDPGRPEVVASWLRPWPRASTPTTGNRWRRWSPWPRPPRPGT